MEINPTVSENQDTQNESSELKLIEGEYNNLKKIFHSDEVTILFFLKCYIKSLFQVTVSLFLLFFAAIFILAFYVVFVRSRFTVDAPTRIIPILILTIGFSIPVCIYEMQLEILHKILVLH